VSDVVAPQVRLDFEMAQAIAAAAADDLTGAEAHLARAEELVARLKRGYEAIQLQALRALMAESAGESPVALLTEALSRAESGGLVRVFADTLPGVVALVSRHVNSIPAATVTRPFIDRVLAAGESSLSSEQQPAGRGRSALLTPKEDQVLRLLAGGLPNKRIATELELSIQTVKWHVKKLLAKLNAGGRDHAVERARMLGLLR
jgi:LuxR family transcriptional regulator, maltose regulon positive regulatory protein